MKLQPTELANVQCEVCHGYATEHLNEGNQFRRSNRPWRFV